MTAAVSPNRMIQSTQTLQREEDPAMALQKGW